MLSHVGVHVLYVYLDMLTFQPFFSRQYTTLRFHPFHQLSIYSFNKYVESYDEKDEYDGIVCLMSSRKGRAHDRYEISAMPSKGPVPIQISK